MHQSLTQGINMQHKTVLNSLSLSVALAFAAAGAGTAFAQEPPKVSYTEVTNWQFGRQAAISFTYDDSSINQFRVAVPLMKSFGFPATFFVITGMVPGSRYQPKFIGPPVDHIVADTRNTPTNKANFFERASALRFVGYKGVNHYFMEAGDQYAKKHLKKAYHLIDEAYEKVRSGKLKPEPASTQVRDYVLRYGQSTQNQSDPHRFDQVTWAQLKRYQSEGFEIASHTISHPYMSILDLANINYELTKSKLELQDHLGRKATFSAEIPFGISNKRAINRGLEIYKALRNWMPEPYLTEINRGEKGDPTQPATDYVQWQRGPLTHTPMKKMKSWVDTALKKDNIWLVLAIHGVDGIGWEPLSGKELKTYFAYVKSKENDVWVATFQDVTKYMREKEGASVKYQNKGDSIVVNLSDSLKDPPYNLPLTLRSYVPSSWGTVKVEQGGSVYSVKSASNRHGRYVLYQAMPNGGTITISKS